VGYEFCEVRIEGILRTSPFENSANFVLTEFSEVHRLLDTKVPKNTQFA
jgi:hypothetical protein